MFFKVCFNRLWSRSHLEKRHLYHRRSWQMTKPLSRSDPKRVTKHESKWNGTLLNGIHCNSTYMFRPGSKHMTLNKLITLLVCQVI